MFHTKRQTAGLFALAVATWLGGAACTATPPPAKPAPSAASGSSGAGNAGKPQEQYRAWIAEARVKHPYADSEQRMFDVMMCESSGRASIVNPAGPYTGLFQYSSTLWKGAWNTYRDQPITDARAQIFATALAWQKNMQSHWTCYRKTAPPNKSVAELR